LIKDTASWLTAGELDPAAGEAAVAALTSEAGPSDERLVPASELFADVAVSQREWGENADSLLSELDDVLKAENDRKRAEEATDLLEKLEEWIDDAEIDADRGERAREVLRPLSRR
jgi:hypothetical protein